MAESIEQRVSNLEGMTTKIFLDFQAIKMLSMALFAENRNSAEVCGNFDALSKIFPDLALGEPIPDAMIDAVETTLKFYQERLAKMGEAVVRARLQKGHG